jgi:hypothetical protein
MSKVRDERTVNNDKQFLVGVPRPKSPTYSVKDQETQKAAKA